jgi:molybdate transport system substrate-binding protein
MRRSCALLLASGLAMLAGCHASARTTLTLSVAASLKEAMAEAESSYRQVHPEVDFRENFGPSGTLEMQIEQGAPADVFLSAAAKPMDALQARGMIATGTRRTLLRGSLVLIAPRDSHLQSFQGLLDPAIRSIALGDPGSVPAGQYGRQTLASLRLLEQVNAKLVLAKDVRQVLEYVESGNADAGLVYATDALTSSKVRVVVAAPESTHDAIVYPVAVVKGRPDEAGARRFVEFLATPAAQAIFEKHGFTMAAP